ncbi:MAG: hypothetical protein COA50_03575 [Flavobacteriaceae bacterium]|nr:MAG: hypothetical protein COA50_03575 [Flavobacteriaceae bacterium]
MNVVSQIKPNQTEKKEARNTSKLSTSGATCSFSGKPADYYIGLSKNTKGESINIVGSVSSEMVEMAINRLMGKGFGDIKWPVILNLKKELVYHTYDAHNKGLSAIFGWKECLPKD